MTAMASHLSKADSDSPTLQVVAGMHHGVSLPMDAPVCVIGAGGGDDVVLSDPGIEAKHVRLRFSAQHVTIEALGGDIQLLAAGHPTRIARGHGFRAALPFDIQLGQARLALQAPAGAPRLDAPVWYGKPQWLIAGAFMFICASALAMFSDTQSGDSRAFIDNLPANANANANALGFDQQVEQAPSLDTVRADLAARASKSGLKSLNLFIANDQLKAKGTLTPEQRPQWVALQQYFDGHYGRYFVLHSTDVEVRAPGAQPRVSFQAVWFGENPYVIDSSGARLDAGAALSDGWVIRDIKDETVELARGEESFYFTLPAAPADES
jgi:type III secretion protein D